MKKRIAFFVLVFVTCLLHAQDSSRVLLVESRGTVTVIAPGQKIKADISGPSRPYKGVLGHVTDSTIRIDSLSDGTGSTIVRIADIREITWYSQSKSRVGAPALIITGGLAMIGGVLVTRAALSDATGQLGDLLALAVITVVAVPLVAGGVALMAAGIANADSERSHSRKIDEKTRLRAGGGKPQAKPATPSLPGSGTAD